MASRRVAAGLLAAAISALSPRPAGAFCGFYVAGADAKLANPATMVVLVRDGTRTVLAMQNDYEGPPEQFALVVPVPVVLHEDDVKTLPREVFDRVDRLAAPRLVEYWEADPCGIEPDRACFAAAGAHYHGGANPYEFGRGALGVQVEAKFAVGEYQIVVLGAGDSLGLDTWLRREGYRIPEGAEPYLRPYVASGMKFFVAKVDPAKVRFEAGRASLSPLRFQYDAETFSLPIRLGLMNSPGTQDLVVHVLARDRRFEVANRPNVTIPTNLDVDASVKDRFSAFYAALFDRTLARSPGAVVTEYAWGAGKCDPCPGGTSGLTKEDLALLGADQLPSLRAEATAPPKSDRPLDTRPRFGQSDLVLTRLHLRYDRATAGEDLVFRAVPPIQGGTEDSTVTCGGEYTWAPTTFEAKISDSNRFQARYAIRHAWTGPVLCAKPVRGAWGGPPSETAKDEPAQPAQGLAFAPRTQVDLNAVVLTKTAGFDPPARPATAAGATGPDAGVTGSGAPPPSRGCGSCAVGEPGAGAWISGLVAAAACAVRTRRRARAGAARRPAPRRERSARSSP